MSQDFRALLGTDTFGDSYGFLNDTALALLTNHSGPSEPTSPVAFQFWADTTTGHLKVRNAANDDWVDWGALGSDLLGALPLAGGTMSGAINMGAQQITNVGLGTGASAARQQELDLKAPIAAPAFTGDAQVNQDPAGNDSIVRRSYTEGRYLKLAGGTMTGILTLLENASNPLEAVPRQQLTACVDFNTTTGHRHTGSDARKVRATDLDAAGSSSGQFLVSAGSGSAPVWTAAAPGPIAFISEVSNVFDTDSAGWTTVSVSGSVPAGATAVILSVAINGGFTSGTTFFTGILKVRKTGTSPTNPATYQHRPFGVPTSLNTIPLTVIAELNSSRQFDYIFTGGGTSVPAHVNAKLVGYFN